MRKKVTSVIVILMLICMVMLGCFAVPIGFTACSLIGLFYGKRYEDKTYQKYSIFGLILGIASAIYTAALIFSM